MDITLTHSKISILQFIIRKTNNRWEETDASIIGNVDDSRTSVHLVVEAVKIKVKDCNLAKAYK